MAVMPPKKPAPMFRGARPMARKPMPDKPMPGMDKTPMMGRGPGSPVKSPHAQPPSRPMPGSQSPKSYPPSVMGGPTPFMQPPAANTSFMDPSKPQASRMYADGGFGDPDMIGGPAAGAPEPDSDDMGGQQPPQPTGTPVAPDPAAVNYHDDEHKCSMCAYMDPQSSMCQVLQMQVSPVGGCTAFHGSEGSPDGSGAPDNGEAPQGNPMGTTTSEMQQ